MRRKKGPLPFGYIATSDGYLEEVPQELEALDKIKDSPREVLTSFSNLIACNLGGYAVRVEMFYYFSFVIFNCLHIELLSCRKADASVS